MDKDQQTVLVIEDEAQIRKFLRISLEAHGFKVLEARTGNDGLEQCSTGHPGLVILDLGLPDMDGVRVIQRLREWSVVPIIVLSVRSDESDKVNSLDAGANDYVTKPFGIAELMARIRALLRTSSIDANTNANFVYGELTIDFNARRVWLVDKDIHLTRKEYDLLRFLATHPGQVLTHAQIMKAVWQNRPDLDSQHLRVLVASLRQKLSDNPAMPEYIVTETGVGYRLGAA